MDVDDLILPEQNKTIVTGAIPVADMEEDNEEPCAVVDEADEDHGHCPICSHNASERGVISKMNDLEARLTGTISPEEIYRIMFQMWEHEVRVPLERQGLSCPELTVEDIRRHYTSHKMNMKNIVSKEILFCNTLQQQLKGNQIAVRNKVTGEKRLVLKGITEWQKLSKHKLDLIKYYNNTLMKKSKTGGGGQAIKPYQFD